MSTEIQNTSTPEIFPGFSLPEDATIEQRLQIAEYVGQRLPLLDELGNTLRVKGIIYYPDWKRDENGDYLYDEENAQIPCYRSVFLLEDGSLRTSTSDVASRFVKDALLPLFGKQGQMGHLITVVSVKIVPIKTKAGRRTYGFSIVGG